jgi:hypothetical protein
MKDIMYCYEQYREKKPVLLFDMQENRIYVYPYLEFKNDLSERSQRSLQEQYEQAMTGFDHGAGHLLRLLCHTKAPNY